jgi:hypothetical protein
VGTCGMQTSLNPAINVFMAIWKFKKGVELQVAICMCVVVTTVRQNGSATHIVTMSQALLNSFLQLK